MRQAVIAHRPAASARASRLPPEACAAPPKKYARRWSGRSSALPEPAHGRCRQSRYRAARDRADRAAAPTTSAARRGWIRSNVPPSFDLQARVAVLAGAAFVAEAGDEMVVDHAGRLHEGVDDGWADEFESARSKFLRNLDRDRRRRRHAGGGLELV